MAYKIVYGTNKFDKKKKPFPWAPAMLAAALLIFCMIPQVQTGLRDMLIPQQQAESVSDAFQQFQLTLEQGDSVGEAVTAFCVRIIENADEE